VFLTFLSIKSGFGLTLLTYSVISGLGMGVVYLLPLEYAMSWFPQHKGLANSAVLFGYGLSSMIFR
jgi:OFA family oxalate/formate antiporter-like MFS transporter